jgi:hypothetical protein
VTSFRLSYDYRCPFAKNIHLHALAALRAGADLSIDFVPWTMSQGYKEPGAPDVWDDPSRDAELLALAVSVSIRDEQPEHFLAAHEALFRARHERAIRLVSMEEITPLLAPLGVNIGAVERDLASRRPHVVLGEVFREFERVEAFGVPTFVLGDDATFVRYMNPPTGNDAESATLIQSLLSLMTEKSALNEFKHTRVPN